MKREKDKSIGIRINRIDASQFALIDENVDEHAMTYNSGFGLGIDEQNCQLRATIKYELMSEERLVLILEVKVDFQINPLDFEGFKTENGHRINRSFACHLCVITVGTARGILHEKTRHSKLNFYPLQTINVEEYFTKDVLFPSEIPPAGAL